jgi:hypothetical protein
MSVYVHSVFVLFCVGSGLATGWSPVQGVLPTMYRIKKLKKRPRPTWAVEPWIDLSIFITKQLDFYSVHWVQSWGLKLALLDRCALLVKNLLVGKFLVSITKGLQYTRCAVCIPRHLPLKLKTTELLTWVSTFIYFIFVYALSADVSFSDYNSVEW